MCTFWSYEDAWDESNGSSEAANANSDSNKKGNQQQQQQQRRQRGFLWNLFICKNFLLVVFGILGLITGTWISISELSASYMGIADAVD